MPDTPDDKSIDESIRHLQELVDLSKVSNYLQTGTHALLMGKEIPPTPSTGSAIPPPESKSSEAEKPTTSPTSGDDSSKLAAQMAEMFRSALASGMEHPSNPGYKEPKSGDSPEKTEGGLFGIDQTLKEILHYMLVIGNTARGGGGGGGFKDSALEEEA